MVREKKACKQWYKSCITEDRQKYFEVKRTTNRCVRKTKGEYAEALYKKLNFREGESEIWRSAKRRMTYSKDMEHYYETKDEQARRLRRLLKITERWWAYFEKVSNIGNNHHTIMHTEAVEELMPLITKVLKAINKARNDKATGPNDIPSEF